MKKHFKDVEITKIKICSALLAAIFGLGACGPKVDDAGDRSSEPSMSTEAEVPTNESTETVDSSESEDMKSSDDVKSGEAVEEPTETDEPVAVEFTCTADDVIALVDDMSAQYTQIKKEELLAVIFSINFDYLTDQDKDIIMSTYGVSYKDLSESFFNYCDSLQHTCVISYRLYSGAVDNIPEDENYKNWVKHVELALNPDDKDFIQKYDDRFYNRSTGVMAMVEHVDPNNMDGFWENRSSSINLTFAVMDYQVYFSPQLKAPTDVFSRQLEIQNEE